MKIFPDRKQLPYFLLRFDVHTPDKLDYERMARVVTGVGRVVEGVVL